MWTSSQGQKDIRITHLNHWPKNLINSLQKQCSFHIFFIGTGTDRCFRYRDSQEWQQSSLQAPKHILCLTPCAKARKYFHGVLPCLVIMYHQTNLDCKSFSISEDLVETVVALTLNIAKWYFWMILWLVMMHHHTKFDRSEILSWQIFTEVQNLHCDRDLEYSKATFSQAYEHALSN